jgi:hypothetical protein
MASLSLGGAILIPSGPSHDVTKKHLFAICSDPDKDGNCLIVPVSTWTNDLCDGTCILERHDHSFIRVCQMKLESEGFP